jgi:surface antigen
MRGQIPQKPSLILSGTEKSKSFPTKTNAKRSKAQTKKLSIAFVASHLTVAAVILGIVIIGYRSPVEATNTPANRSVIETPVPTVDQIAAAEVASSVAQMADVPVAANVANLSISLNAKTESAQTDAAFLSKPQIVGQNTGKKGIGKYVAKAGDTVQSVAVASGVSEDTIRWANKLTSDAITPGSELLIPGTTGVIYTVKNGDDPQGLAERYHADKDRIVAFNDAELVGLRSGQQIVIPDGVLPTAERPGYRVPQTLASPNSTSSNIAVTGNRIALSPGNGYAYGYCTYYAYNRRAEIGKPIGGNWGDAVAWVTYARAAGFDADHTPSTGAVIQNGGGWGGFGHVGIVEKINDDGSLLVSDMNYAGWNIVSTRTVPASSVSSYNYIH